MRSIKNSNEFFGLFLISLFQYRPVFNPIIFLVIALAILLIAITFFWAFRWFKKNAQHFFPAKQNKEYNENHKVVINAYERLILLCERIQPDKLAIRFQSPHLTAQELSQAMIVAVHQEFEHNVTQQIYISENLWNIICLTKDEVIFEIIQTTAELPPESEGRILTQKLLEQKQQSPINQALKAIRKEAHQYVKI